MSSSVVGKVGYYEPFLLVGAVFVTIGGGLIYTYDLPTSLGKVIGYQILFGVGTGLSVQIPVIVAGAKAGAEDQAVALSTVLCECVCAVLPLRSHALLTALGRTVFQFVSAAYGVGSTDAILNNLILQKAPVYTGGVDGHKVLAAGAGGLPVAFDGNLLRGARMAYLDGLRGSWALAIALFGITFLCALGPARGGKLSPKVGADGKEEKVLAVPT